MAQKKFSELEAGTVDGTSIFAQTKTEDGSLVSKSASSPSLAGYIGTSHQFAGLSTTAKNLVGAINEAASMGGVVQLTQAEYTALTTAEKMNGSIYKLTDKAIFYCLDEEYHAVKELTSAQYEALSTAQQNNGTIYIQTDAETTGSDIPVSSGATETIAEAIEDLNSPSQQTIRAGANVTSFLNVVFKTGKVVNGYIVFKPTATVADLNTIFASGLPVPASNTLIIIPVICIAGTNVGKSDRVAINANGDLVSWYHTSGFFNTTDTYFVATNYAAK